LDGINIDTVSGGPEAAAMAPKPRSRFYFRRYGRIRSGSDTLVSLVFPVFFPIRFKLKNSFVTENLIAYDAQINTIDQSFGKMMSLGVLNVSLRMVVYYNNTLIILIQTNNSKKYLLLFFNATWNYRW
jgi:hypothetical protein